MSERTIRLFERSHGVFVPFLMLGDPHAGASERLIEAAIEGGADALELGIPFSDPIADGPVVQEAALRARSAGVTVGTCFELLARIRGRHPTVPIGLLVYANLVVARGTSFFYQRAAHAGVDSILVADLPLGEAAPFLSAATEHGIDPVFVLPANASEETLRAVSSTSRGYTYVLARDGVTGSANEPGPSSRETFRALRRYGAPPALVGFGISRPDHVRAAISAGAAGAIAGSSLIDRAAREPDVTAKVRAVREHVEWMSDAAHRTLLASFDEFEAS